MAPLFTALVLVGAWWLFAQAPRERDATRLTQFTLPLPEGVSLYSAPIVSPDSQHIAFVGGNANGSRLYVHTLNAREPRAVRGTEGAKQPFWAPDSKSFGFFAGGRLIKVAWPGGAPREYCGRAVRAWRSLESSGRHPVRARYRPVWTPSRFCRRRSHRAGNCSGRFPGRQRPQLAGIPPGWESLPLLRALHE